MPASQPLSHPRHSRTEALGPWVWQLLVITPVFLVLASCTAVWLVVHANQTAALQQLMAQQEDETELLATLIASKLEQSQKTLAAVAEVAAPWVLSSKPSLEWLVEQGLPAASYFDSLVFARGTQVFRLGLRADADAPAHEIDPAERDLLRRIMVSGKPQVSDPLPSSIGGEPSIAFGMPLRNDAGDLLGAMAGVLRLQSQSLLPAALAMPAGDDSRLVVMTTAGVIISHPEAVRIRGLAAHEPTLAQALQLWHQRPDEDRKTATLAQWQAPYLISMAEIPSTRWLVLRIVNQDNAIAHTREASRHTLWRATGVVFSLAALMLAWLWWHTRHVRALHTALPAEPAKAHHLDDLPPSPEEPLLHGNELQRAAQLLYDLQTSTAHLKRATQQQQHVIDAALEHVALPVLLLNKELIIYVSQALAHLFGFNRTDLQGQPVHILTMQACDMQALRLTLAPALQRYGEAEADAVLRHQSGTPVPVLLQLVLVPEESTDWLWCLVRLIAPQKTDNTPTNNLDKLTQLPNYNALLLHLTAMLQASDATAHNAPILLYVNIDNMSAINALAGHPQGDMVLQHTARQLQLLTPFQGFAARVTGDKFALVLPPYSAQQAPILAQQLCDAVAQWQPQLQGQQFSVTLSVCLLALNGQLCDAQSVIRTADMACYEAKRLGGNCVHWVRPPMPTGTAP